MLLAGGPGKNDDKRTGHQTWAPTYHPLTFVANKSLPLVGTFLIGETHGGDEKRRDFSLFRIASRPNWVPIYHPLTFLATTAPFIAYDVLFVVYFGGGGGGRNNE